MCGVKKTAFLSGFAEQFQLSSNTVKLLKEEALDCQTALLGLSEENLKELEGLKLGERAALRVAAASLQSKAGGEGGGGGGEGLWPRCPLGHLRRPRTADGAAWTTSHCGWRAWASALGSRSGTQGEPPLKIVDFLSPALLAEEEVVLGGGVTLKINSKSKLAKVSPAMWVVANTRIMKAMMARPGFSAEQYLSYTEMIGELACRFTWMYALLFEEEYRQHHAAVGFPWGTEAPHLSTILLRDRQQGLFVCLFVA